MVQQQQNKDKHHHQEVEPYYLDACYDIKFIFTTLDVGKNILSRIMNAFNGMLNRTTKLVMLDEDFVKISADYKLTEKSIAWIIGNIIQALGKRK